MSDKVGNVSYYDSTGQTDFAFSNLTVKKTAELIDQEAKQMIDDQYARAIKVLTDHKDGHAQLQNGC
jgi:cell division protease FtsH